MTSVSVGDWVVLEGKAGVVCRADGGKINVEIFEKSKKRYWRGWSDVQPMFGEPRKASAEVGDFVRMREPVGEVGQVRVINGGRINVELSSKGQRVWRTFGDIGELPAAAAAAALQGGTTNVAPTSTGVTSVPRPAAAPTALTVTQQRAPAAATPAAPVAAAAAAVGPVQAPMRPGVPTGPSKCSAPPAAAPASVVPSSHDEPTGGPVALAPAAATTTDGCIPEGPVLILNRARDMEEEEMIKARATKSGVERLISHPALLQTFSGFGRFSGLGDLMRRTTLGWGDACGRCLTSASSGVSGSARELCGRSRHEFADGQ